MANSPTIPGRLCLRMLSANNQGWPARKMLSAETVTRKRSCPPGRRTDSPGPAENDCEPCLFPIGTGISRTPDPLARKLAGPTECETRTLHVSRLPDPGAIDDGKSEPRPAEPLHDR